MTRNEFKLLHEVKKSVLTIVSLFFIIFTINGCKGKNEIIWWAPITGSDKGVEWSPNYLLKPEVRREIILGFHSGKTTKEISQRVGVSEEKLKREIDFLYKKDLLTTIKGKTRPYMLVLLPEDLHILEEISEGINEEIFDLLSDKWKRIDSVISKLSISNKFEKKRIRFELVGCYLLDDGLLDAFHKDGELIPPPPKRAGGEYYAIFIQGPKKEIEKVFESFGYTVPFSLPYRDIKYYPIYFCPTPKQVRLRSVLYKGMGRVDRELLSKLGKFMDQYERYYNDINYQLSKESKEYLIQARYLDKLGNVLTPIYTEEDLEKVDSLVRPLASEIFKIFKDKKEEFEKAYLKTSAGNYPTKRGLAGFINRSVHVVFSSVIRKMMRKNLITPYIEGDSDYWLQKYKKE